MKAVMISIQPKWCELIASGKKTVEVRKTKPKIETPFKVYIYCTKGRGETLWRWDGQYWYDTQFPKERPNRADGKVIGEFVCDRINYVRNYGDCVDMYDCYASCLTASEIIEYAKDKNGNFVYTYGWHISDLVIYDKPKELSEFAAFCEGLKPYQCDKCEYSYTESNESIGTYHGCGCDNLKPLKRPPQSWWYVKERNEK